MARVTRRGCSRTVWHSAPGETRSVGIVVPWTGPTVLPVAAGLDTAAWLAARASARSPASGAKSSTASRSACRRKVSPIVDTLRTSLAHILVTRDGAILRPGTRSYARSWIRDGAMMSEALLRLGHARRRGGLPALVRAATSSPTARCRAASTRAAPIRCPRTTAHGEFIFLSPSLYRYTGDRALLRVAVAARRGRRALHGRAAPVGAHRRQPDAGAARLLRPAAGVDQPRGLLGKADALVLGRLLGARGLRGRRRHRHGARTSDGAVRELGAAARRVPARPRRVARARR